MTVIPLIRQHHFGTIASTLDSMNVGVGRLLQRHGIPDWRYRAPEDAIPLIHFVKTLDVGARATGEERFGISVAERNRLDQFPGFGQAVTGSLTVYDALRTACRLATEEATTVRFWLRRTPGGVLFCRKQLMANPDIEAAMRQLERFTLTMLVQIVRLGAGPDWRPNAAWLSVAEDASVSSWEALADARIHFGTPCSAILVPDHILGLPLAGPCRGAETAERHLTETWAEQDLASTLRLALRSLLHQGGADVDNVAEIVGTSTRTLQRRLTEQGTSFSEILEQARYQEAVALLEQSEIAVADVSESVGYEHPQHFIRAFRRWAGVTPGRYRACLAGPHETQSVSAVTSLRLR